MPHGHRVLPKTRGPDYAFLRKKRSRLFGSISELAFAALQTNCAIRTGRFSRQLFENAIKLRERLKPDRESDLTNAQTRILQKIARFVESGARHVIDKIYAGDLLELFAQMIAADVHRFRYFLQGKRFIRILVDELPCFPDFHRLSPIAVSGAERFGLICERHLCHPTSSNFDRGGDALRPLPIARLILPGRQNQPLLA
jgi:hypothetical protein